MEKDQLKKISSAIFVLILLTINITKVISFTDSIKFNMALSDFFIPFFLFLSLVFWKKYSFKQVYPFFLCWSALVFWIIMVALFAIKNAEILDAGWLGLLEELVKTGLCIIYFFVGYNTLKVINLKTINFTWSFSTIIFVIGGFIIYLLAIKGLYFWSDDPKYLMMFMGTDTDPNHAATFLTLSFFGMGISAMLSKHNICKSYYYLVMFMSVLGLIFTGSRGGLSGFILGILVLVCYYAYKNWRIAIALVLIFILISMVFITFDQMFLESVFTQRLLYKLIDIESGIDVRTNLSKVAWMMGIENPIFGVGRGNYLLNSPKYFEQIGVDYIDDIPHNTYLGLFAETGIIGLILFCMPFFLLIYTLFKRYKNNRELLIEEIPIQIWVGASLFALGVQAFVLNVENRRFLWYLAGLLLFLLTNVPIIHRKQLNSIKIKHLTLGLIGLSFLVSISSIFIIHYAHSPYQSQIVKQNYSFEIPYKNINIGDTYTIGIKLSIGQNDEQTDRVLLKIVEISTDGKKRIIDSYSYKGARGIVERKFTPMMKNSKIYLDVQKLDQSLGTFTILPLYLHDNNNVIDISQWYFLQPESMMYKTLEKNKQKYDDWVEKTDLSVGINATFENQLCIEEISVEQKNTEVTEVTVSVKVLNNINKKLVPFLRGYAKDLHVMEEEQYSYGVEGYNLLYVVDSSTWTAEEVKEITFLIPRQNGIYNLKLGFYHVFDDKAVYLYVDNKKESKSVILDLGWLNLDTFTEGIIYE